MPLETVLNCVNVFGKVLPARLRDAQTFLPSLNLRILFLYVSSVAVA